MKKVHEKDQPDMFVMYIEHGNSLQILTCILGGTGLCAAIFPGSHLSDVSICNQMYNLLVTLSS